MSSSTLRTFSLKGQSLKCDTADAIEPHLESLKEDDDVELVVMGGNTFGIGACEKLGLVLKDKTKLKEADLADIFTGRLIAEIPQSLASLCNSLLNLQSLTVVDLSDNAFGGRCVDAMVPFLSSHLALEELRLANNGLGPAGATVIANALYELGVKAQTSGQPSRLRKIVCGRNRCENGSMAAWGKVFEIHSELTEVRLFQNDIRNDGWAPIMAGLAHCSKLQVLDMWDNTATEKGSKAVAAALPNLVNLRELNLGDCLLRPRGGALIARALKLGNNPNLEHLKLSGSEIDEEVIGLLVEFVQGYGSKLKKVELNDNYGDPEAAEELSGIWGAMKSALDAWDNGAELDELDAIVEKDSDDEGEGDDDSDNEEEEETKEEEEDDDDDEEEEEEKEKEAEEKQKEKETQEQPEEDSKEEVEAVVKEEVKDEEEEEQPPQEATEPTQEAKEEPAQEAKEEPAQEAKEEPTLEAKEEPTLEAKEEPNVAVAAEVHPSSSTSSAPAEASNPSPTVPLIPVQDTDAPADACPPDRAGLGHGEGNVAAGQPSVPSSQLAAGKQTLPSSALPASATKKTSKEDGLYDLLTQTLEALKIA